MGDLRRTPGSSRRRLPLTWSIVIAAAGLAALAAVTLLLSDRLPDPQVVGPKCMAAILAEPMNTDEALFELSEYRRALGGKVDERVDDALLRLGALEAYQVPLPDDRVLFSNVAFMERVVSTFPSRKDPQHSSPRELALDALAYVFRNFQSDAVRDADLPPVPIYPLLLRGHGDSRESAWLMASLVRFCREQATIIQLPAVGEASPYALCGVAAAGRLYLFDPYRGVPVLREDGTVADLASVVSGKVKLAEEGQGGSATVSVEALRKAKYMVPVDPMEMTRDAWLLGRLADEDGRTWGIFHDAEWELWNAARLVFGQDAKIVQSDAATLTLAGRDEVVMIWEFPFLLAKWQQKEEYRKKVIESERASMVPGRDLQIAGKREEALSALDETIAAGSAGSVEAENAAFFRTRLLERQERSAALEAYLTKYPKGRWVALAKVLQADAEVGVGNMEKAAALAEGFPPPYELRGKLLAEALRKTGKNIGWRYPDMTGEKQAQ